MYELEPGKSQMFVHEDIAKDDLIAFIPEEMLLTVEGALEKSPNV